MILIAVSWLWIGISALCVGYAMLSLLNKLTGYAKLDMDMVLLTGICFLTVYAEFFSLVYKVGAAATVLLLCIVLAVAFLMRKSFWQYIRNMISKLRTEKTALVLGVGGAIVVLVLITSGDILHYDTGLYHAQSIRWIEEYGVVRGLGNLHNRLAYNSSVFCLQALFSMKFLVNQSLHSVNGFITMLLLSYGVLSVKAFRQRRFFVSDFLRLGLIIFLNDPQNYLAVSSSGSDHLALGLVFYILIKWISLWEDKEEQEAPYAYLCLLALFDVSVKLSAAMIVLLMLYPAVKLIKQKKRVEIGCYIFAGFIIILPFLIRNVMISGYLLYPYPELDLFDVDWKMPAYTLTFDRNEIKVWGWGLNNVRLFDTPFREWFVFWYGNLSRFLKQLFVLNVLTTIVAFIYSLYKGFKRDWRYFLIVLTVTACFALWFIGAPLSRYGSAYMMMMPLLVLGKLLVGECKERKFASGEAAAIMIALLSYCMYPILHYGMNCEWKYKRTGADYYQYTCNEYKLGEETIYVPQDGDQAGYYAFPSTPYAARLDLIELRGRDISEGFRMKEEYRDAFVTTYGYLDDRDMFSSQE
ncbi:MAG: hypothetical protein NC541_08925 [bacterium]|nr:hypothetical protein [bacterium]